MRRALDAVRTGEADGIVAISLDRLSRNVREFLRLVDESDKQQWRMVLLDQNLDSTSATGRMILAVLAAVAQLARDQISERTQSALAHVAREGRSRSRDLPYGWRSARGGARTVKGDKSPIVKHSGEQKTLRKMLKMDERGDGPQVIANALNKSGTRTRGGKLWIRQAVAGIIANYEARQEALEG